MASWSDFTDGVNLKDFFNTLLNDKLKDLGRMLGTGSPTNVPIDFVRFNRATDKWEVSDGVGGWSDLATTYDIDVTELGGFPAADYPRLNVANTFSNNITIQGTGVNFRLNRSSGTNDVDLTFQHGGTDRAKLQFTQAGYLEIEVKNAGGTTVNRLNLGQTNYEALLGTALEQIWHDGPDTVPGGLPSPAEKQSTAGTQNFANAVQVQLPGNTGARQLTIESARPQLLMLEDDFADRNYAIRGGGGDLQVGYYDDALTAFTNILRYDESQVRWETPSTAPEPGLIIQNNNNLTLGSTNHGFTVGTDTAQNIATDDRGIEARNNGGASQISINSVGHGKIIGPNGGHMVSWDIEQLDGPTTKNVAALTANVNGDHGKLFGGNSSSGNVTINLPSAPQIGMTVGVEMRQNTNHTAIVAGGVDVIYVAGEATSTTEVRLYQRGDHIWLWYRGNNIWTTLSYYSVARADWSIRGHINGYQMRNDPGDLAHDIEIARGEATSDDGEIVIRRTGATTKRIDAAWAAGDNQGGLDTGTVGANDWYHVFVIFNDSTGSRDALFSLSASSPNLPSGYTHKRRIGAVRTDASSNILAFLQVGDRFYWDPPVEEGLTLTTDGLKTLSRVPDGVRCEARLTVWMRDSGATDITRIESLSRPSEFTSAVTPSSAEANTTNWGFLNDIPSGGVLQQYAAGQVDVLTDTNGQFRWDVRTIDEGDIAVHSYKDFRGIDYLD